MSDKKRVFRSAYERAEKHAAGFSKMPVRIPEGVKVYKPTAGVAFLDILAYVVGKGNPNADEGEYHFERTYFSHRNIGPAGDVVVCLARTFNQPCPVCEMRADLKKDPDADADTVKQMGWKERQLFWVFDRKNPDDGWQLFEYSYHLFGKKLDSRIRADREMPDEEKEGWGKFAHPVKGKTLRVTWVEKSIGDGTCIEADSIDLKDRKEPYDFEVCDKLDCLDDLLIVESYKKLKARLTNSRADEEGAEEEDDAPPAKKRAAAEEEEEEAPKKKRPAAEEEEEEEEAPRKKKPAAEEEEEEEAPKKKRVSEEEEEEEAPRKKKPAAEEEEEEEPAPKKKKFTEEEEEEAPRKKRPAAEEEEEEEPAPKKKRVVEEEEEEAPKKKRPAAEEEEEEEAPKKKKAEADDDWPDEEEPKKKKKVVEEED